LFWFSSFLVIELSGLSYRVRGRLLWLSVIRPFSAVEFLSFPQTNFNRASSFLLAI
jgi:hypothetical protein